jgi:hypothetical protein
MPRFKETDEFFTADKARMLSGLFEVFDGQKLKKVE